MELAEPASTPAAHGVVWLRDVISLAKPRLSALVVGTTAVGMAVAPRALPAGRAGAVLGAVALLVASANSLNNVIERHSDRAMRRTCRRPLAAGRLGWRSVQAAALGLGGLALVVLYLAANPLAALLGFSAWSSYVWAYTPMKAKSAWAVVVGTLPGALPPLIGWVAATARMGAGGLALFALMVSWQLPHFLAIAMRLADDYARAGLPVLPARVGMRRARWATVAAAALFVASLALPGWAGLGGAAWAWAAPPLGLGFLASCLWRPEPVGAWARRVFVGSIAVLAALLCLLWLGGRAPR